jgi:hypothetical protein
MECERRILLHYTNAPNWAPCWWAVAMETHSISIQILPPALGGSGVLVRTPS